MASEAGCFLDMHRSIAVRLLAVRICQQSTRAVPIRDIMGLFRPRVH